MIDKGRYIEKVSAVFIGIQVGNWVGGADLRGNGNLFNCDPSDHIPAASQRGGTKSYFTSTGVGGLHNITPRSTER